MLYMHKIKRGHCAVDYVNKYTYKFKGSSWKGDSGVPWRLICLTPPVFVSTNVFLLYSLSSSCKKSSYWHQICTPLESLYKCYPSSWLGCHSKTYLCLLSFSFSEVTPNCYFSSDSSHPLHLSLDNTFST